MVDMLFGVRMTHRTKRALAVERPCTEGCCTELVNPETGEVMAWVPVECPWQEGQ